MLANTASLGNLMRLHASPQIISVYWVDVGACANSVQPSCWLGYNATSKTMLSLVDKEIETLMDALKGKDKSKLSLQKRKSSGFIGINVFGYSISQKIHHGTRRRGRSCKNVGDSLFSTAFYSHYRNIWRCRLGCRPAQNWKLHCGCNHLLGSSNSFSKMGRAKWAEPPANRGTETW